MKKIISLLVSLIIISGDVCAAAKEKAVPILLYHNIAVVYNSADDALNVTPERFQEQLSSLKDAGYTIIPFQQYIEYANGNTDVPEKSVVVTFDDGYSSVYYYGFPILMRLEVPATVFVISGLLGFNDTVYPHFTWEQAKEMDNSGYVDIQSHSNFHYNAKEISSSRLILELRKSKYDIETRLNKKCNILAFPYGEYDAQGLSIAKAAGFSCVARTRDWGTNRKSDGLFNLNRIFVHGSWTGKDLIAEIEKNNLM
ncbi:MAG: polysaccharide deacetylase family protein [Clostridia bacterium]|nr:polysaccharide deacetylase family protein [Clostridia bacterium]